MLIAAAGAYVSALAMVWIVFAIIKELGGFEIPWTMLLLIAAFVAPYIAGKVGPLRILRDVWREAEDAEKLKRQRR